MHQDLRFDICISMISLTKIAHQRRSNHLFSQKNKAAELAVRVGVGGNSEGRWTKFEKWGLGSIGGGDLREIGGFRTPLCKP